MSPFVPRSGHRGELYKSDPSPFPPTALASRNQFSSQRSYTRAFFHVFFSDSSCLDLRLGPSIIPRPPPGAFTAPPMSGFPLRTSAFLRPCSKVTPIPPDEVAFLPFFFSTCSSRFPTHPDERETGPSIPSDHPGIRHSSSFSSPARSLLLSALYLSDGELALDLHSL